MKNELINNYIEIPNNIVWGYKDKNSYISTLKDYKVVPTKTKGKDSLKSLINKYKIIQIFYGLYILTDPYRNICRFTIEGLANVAKINNDKNELKSIKLILDKLLADKLIIVNDSTFSFEEIRSNAWIELIPNYFVYKSETNNDIESKVKVEYFKVYDSEFNKILSYKKSGINNSELLVLFAYYTSRIHYREVYTDAEGNKTKFSIELSNSEVCYPTYEDIYKDTLISSNVVKKYNDILVDLKLIKYKNAGNRRLKQADGKIVTLSSSNTIALCRNENAELEIDKSIEAYIASQTKIGFIFVGEEKTKKDMSKKQISNTINRIEAIKKEKGTISEKNRIKLNLCLQKQMENNVIESISEDNVKWTNKALLDSNEGILLSTIFLDMGRYKEAEKYLDIEVSLGMVEVNYDDEDEEVKKLLIDWKYYKHIMVNYSEAEHLKYFNYVKKHISVCKPVPKVKHLGKSKPQELNDVLSPGELDLPEAVGGNIENEDYWGVDKPEDYYDCNNYNYNDEDVDLF